MSAIAVAWARQQRCGGATLKAVLVAVALHADDKGQCWPSQNRLAEETELDRKTVRESLKALETAGLLYRERFDREDGSRGSDRLNLRLQGCRGEAPPPGGERPLGRGEAPGDRGEDGRGVGASGPGGGGEWPHREETPEETPELSCAIVRDHAADDVRDQPKTRKPKAPVEPDGWPEWYAAFPKKRDPGRARKLYDRIVRNGMATPAELLTGAERYRAERRGQDDRYTQHPATWLNGEGWKNEPTGKPPASVAATGPEKAAGQRALVRKWQASPTSWAPKWGPPPGQPGCVIPVEILAEFGVRSAA